MTADRAVIDTLMIRRALPDEDAVLSELVIRSKAHWGYLPEFLDLWRDDMRVTPEKIVAEHIYVAEREGRVIGYVALKPIERDVIELDDLFIAPEAMGQGVGRILWDYAVSFAQNLGCQRLEWDADPFAEPFYRHMGAHSVGFTQSTYFAERLLPHMVYELV